MTYKQIETSREVRLWTTSIIIPAMVLLVTKPEVRQFAVNKANEIKITQREIKKLVSLIFFQLAKNSAYIMEPLGYY